MSLYQELCNPNNKSLGLLLGLFNIKYVLVNSSSTQEDACRVEDNYLRGDPANFIRIMERQKDINLVVNEKEFKIFRNKEFVPHIALYTDILFFPKSLGKTPFEQVKESSVSNNFHNNYRLPVFEEQLSTEEKRFILSNPRTSIFSPRHLKQEKTDNAAITPEFLRISATEYRINVNNSKPIFIFLGEIFHPSWNAFCKGEKLRHLPALFGNVFYLDKTGQNTVLVVFEEQKIKNLTVLIAAFAWVFLFVTLTFSLIMEYVKKNKI